MINQNHLILLSFGKRGMNPEGCRGDGIIRDENPGGHCILLRDLTPINFSK